MFHMVFIKRFSFSVFLLISCNSNPYMKNVNICCGPGHFNSDRPLITCCYFNGFTYSLICKGKVLVEVWWLYVQWYLFSSCSKYWKSTVLICFEHKDHNFRSYQGQYASYITLLLKGNSCMGKNIICYLNGYTRPSSKTAWTWSRNVALF
jgi:hypothetical protein